MDGKNGLQPVEKTVIDRCVRTIYRSYINDPKPENMPILEDLYDELRRQEEKEAQYIATALEIYVHGSLNVFNHRTNINIQSRVVSYDIKELGKQLKKIGMLIVQDAVWNRVTINREAKKSTRDYIDEIEDNPLPKLTEGEVLDVEDITVKEGKTTPPKRFTEDTLLAAMESAGKEDMPDDAERKGIGTPATRASILEKLVATGFAKREKTSLIPAGCGSSLVAVLPEELQSPLLTAEWELELKAVEKGEMSPEQFMSGISEMIAEIVKTYTPVKGSEKLFPSDRDVIGKCPRCGGNVTESKLGFFCEHSDCRFGLWKDNRFFSSKRVALNKKVAIALLADGKVHMDKLYSEKTGKEYSADIILVDNGETVRFTLEFTDKKA